jgi:aldehyde:ferredoxin oxidoreductase
MKGGYTGKVLRVDLTHKTYKVESLPDKVAREYVGGAGLGIKYLYDEVPAGADPLSPENKMIFASGPLTGTKAPSSSRLALATKSPLTGAVAMALSGGHFPVELKFAGYDVLIIEGKSEEPVYLWIKDDKVTFRPANNLWGTTTFDCEQMIKNNLNDQNIRVACIGPAGERLSKMACIMNEHNRAFGRRGVGAVMGSKNLKAIAVRGSKEVPIACEEAFNEAHSKILKAFKEAPGLYPALGQFGTPCVIEVLWGIGAFPAKNFTETGEWDPVPGLGVGANEARKIGKEPCYRCPVACSQVKLVKDGPYIGKLSVPEYESVFSLGGHLGIDNMDAVTYADRICNELGLDTISTGVTIGFAMELYEKGLINKEDTDGLELNFGNEEAMLVLIPKIAYRKGFGDVLADGSKIAAERIGKQTEKYAMHIKGLELPGYDPRAVKTHGFSFATTYTGADHNKGYASQDIFGAPVPEPVDRLDPKGKGRITKWNQDHRAVCCDSATMCNLVMDANFEAGPAQNTADMVNAVAGLDFTADEILKVGERINNLARVFNVREGFDRKDDTFPERILTEPIKDGASKGQYIPKEDLDLMLDEYYAERGWDSNGIPTKEKLNELGLENVVNDLGL